MVYKLRSEKIDWDSTTKHWKIYNYYIRHLHDDKDIIIKGELLDTVFPFVPSDFSFAEHLKDVMTTPQIIAYIDEMQRTGQSDIEFYAVERWRRTSNAFSIYIMTLIGVSVASRKVRGGLGWHIVLGIGLSALYEIIMKFTITFSTNASLPPILGVWIPNILYAGLAIYLLKKAPK